MLFLQVRLFAVYAIVINLVLCEIVTNDVNSDETNEIVEEKSGTWIKSAQDIIASPAGNVAVQVAKELLNRSTGNSQVLSLNLTNLLIIALLKILIFAAGMLGAGHWSSNGYGYARSAARSNNAENSVSGFGFQNGEDYIITGFLTAQGSGMDDCLYAAACDSPTIAYQYAKAAKALLDGIQKFEGPINNPRYNDLIVLVEKAAYDGYRGVPCNTTLKCDGQF